MLLVADSGSTKTDWILADRGRDGMQFTTTGFNPNFNSAEFIFNALNNSETLRDIAPRVSKLYFFGSGCSPDNPSDIVFTSLKSFFIAADIVVDNDLQGSILATCGDEAGIACILGTGSNACYYDGKKIHPNNSGLGYILGDEAAGTYFGKKIITAYLYNTLPLQLREKFEQQYKLDREITINRIYRQPGGNTWIASFTEFLGNNKGDEWVKSLIKNGFREFFSLFICTYENYKIVPAHFVGGIASGFEELLREIAIEKEVTVGKIIRRPIEELADYFFGKLNKS